MLITHILNDEPNYECLFCFTKNKKERKKIERCYVHNIFITNHWWLVVIDSNLNLTLRLFFCFNNNNLPLKICYKNIVDISSVISKTLK